MNRTGLGDRVLRQVKYHENNNIVLRIVKTFDDRKEFSIFDSAEEKVFKKVTFSTGSLAFNKELQGELSIMDSRPPIPADIRRRVLVEAGHRCSIPACRYIDADVHHIISWSQCQAHEYDNLIALCPNCHRRAESGEIDRKSLRLYKFNLRFAHDKFSQLEMDILFELNKVPNGQGIMWPPFMHILLKRLIDSKYIQIIQPTNIFGSIGGMRVNPDTLVITSSGRSFLVDLGLHEM